MSRLNFIRSFMCAAHFLFGIGSASGKLLDGGPGMVRDDALNITWTRNANLIGAFADCHHAKSRADDLVFSGGRCLRQVCLIPLGQH